MIRQHPTPLTKVRRQIENVASINIWMEVDPHDGFLSYSKRRSSQNWAKIQSFILQTGTDKQIVPCQSTTKKISFDGHTARFYSHTQNSEALYKPPSFNHSRNWGGRALLYNLRHQSLRDVPCSVCVSHHVLFSHPLAHLILDFSTYHWFLIVFWVYKWLDKYFGLDKLH